MNNRIKELRKEAMVKVHSHGAFGEHESYWELDDDKFAKLLIEECAVTAELHARTYSDGNAGSGCYGAASAIRVLLKD